MGWGTADAAGAEGQEEGEAVAAVEVMAGEEWNKNVQLAAALGCVSQKCLHWLLRREALHFHSAQVVDAFMEPWVYHLLKVINKANVTKSGDGSVNLKLSNEFLNRAVTLVQGGELPPGSCLAVQVCKCHGMTSPPPLHPT